MEDRCLWLMPVILVTQKAEIKRIEVCSRPAQAKCEILYQKTPNIKKKKG
jgi:hypothetical protein